MAGIAVSGGKMLASQEARGILRRFFYWIKKKLLNDLNCIVAEDFSLNQLKKLEMGPEYKVVYLEKILHAMASDMERSSSMQLKRLDYHVWMINNFSKLKLLLNSMRWNFKGDRLVVVLSSVKLAELLHIKKQNIHVFQMADSMFYEIEGDSNIDLQSKEYLRDRRLDNMVNGVIEYESFDQLKRLIEKKFC